MTKEEILDKLVQDIRLRGLSEDTVAEYHIKARVFMEHFDKPADQMGEAEFREFLQYLQEERKLSPASINTYNSGLRFLYEVTLEQNLNYKRIPRAKEPILLPNIMTVREVQKFFDVIDDLRYKAIFLTVYGSGLRLREIRHLRISDVDSEQMRLFIYQSKGKKDRFAVLSQISLTRRFLMHILPPGFMKIRHYGLLGNRNKNAKLKVCKQLTHTPIILKGKASTLDLIRKILGKDISKCPVCGCDRLHHYMGLSPPATA